jgi:tetratricopeptide (TPR) repeat protein
VRRFSLSAMSARASKRAFLGVAAAGAAAFIVCVVAIPAYYKHGKASKEPLFTGLGDYTRRITTSSPITQRYFDQGLAFLYAFNYDEALRSFQAAAVNDPRCGMAYWGIAMAHGPDPNFPNISKAHGHAGLQALLKACELKPAASPAEKALIGALCERFDEPLPDNQEKLNEAYARAMVAVHASFPDDADIGALAAEALMICRRDDPISSIGSLWSDRRAEAIAILERVLTRYDRHPLAIHLLIHACEYSPWPEKALRAAETLRSAPSGLGHLLHMPSHIDARLGHWSDAVIANEKAIEADRTYSSFAGPCERYQEYENHNYHMLAFAALMSGQSNKAKRASQALVARLRSEHDTNGLAWNDRLTFNDYLTLPYDVSMRFGWWDSILAENDPGEAVPFVRALWHYARGIAYAAKKEIMHAKSEEQAFKALQTIIAADADSHVWFAQRVLSVKEKNLDGEILYREHRLKKALMTLREAVEQEDTLTGGDPPRWNVPARHILGAMLMDSGQCAEAERVYKEDLRRYPENGWSLYGLMQSLKRQGKAGEAVLVNARLRRAWKDADFTLPSSCCCLPIGDSEARKPH